MKYLMSGLAILLISLFVVPVQAQEMTKAEEKIWKKRAKEYKSNPKALMELFEQKEESEMLVEQLQQRMEVAQQRNQALESQLTQVQSQLAETQNKLTSAQSKNQTVVHTTTAAPSSSGRIYKVQIAAFREMGNQIPDELKSTNGLQMEYDEGFQKIILGNFRVLSEAESLQRHLVRIGLTDAFVAAYDDGVRIPLDQDNIIGNE